MQFNQVIKKATIVNSSINALLAILKIIIGIIGQSQALLADGIHSFSDLLSDGFVYLAAKASQKKADEDHPYGHKRIETIASMLMALMLIAAGIFIVYQPIIDLLNQHIALHTPDRWVTIVAIISVLANEYLYRFTAKLADENNSSLLRSYAWHNRSDAFVSLVVLVSLLGAHLGWPHLDAIAAAFIAFLIAKTGIKMLWQGVRELIDTAADEKTVAAIRDAINRTPGVNDIHLLRTRSLGGNIFVDVHIIVEPKISVSEGHHISDQVHAALLKQIPSVSDVTVHIDPEDDEKYMPCLQLPNRPTLLKQLEPYWQNLPQYQDIHRVVLHYIDGHIDIDLCIQSNESSQADASNLSLQYQNAAKDLSYVHHVTIYQEL